MYIEPFETREWGLRVRWYKEVLNRWREQWVPKFPFPKPWELSKVMMILKVWGAGVKKWARHIPLNFKKELAVIQSILELEGVSKSQNNEKSIAESSLLSNVLKCLVIHFLVSILFYYPLIFSKSYVWTIYAHRPLPLVECLSSHSNIELSRK